MPIFEGEDYSRDRLTELRKSQVCKECGGFLNLFYDPHKHTTFLACNDWHRSHHKGIARESKLFEENIISRRERMEKEMGTEKAMALAPYSGAVLKTEEEATKVMRTIWPEAPIENMKVAAMICVQYELNPLMKHIYLIKFDKYQYDKVKREKVKVGESWATVLGIQASRLIAHRAGDYSYINDTPRVMTDDEQKRVFGEVSTDRIWAITKLRDAKGMEAVGYGFYLKSENPYGTDKGNTRANMAFIRSERQAMDRLFAGKMPQAIEVIDERYMETENGREVDTVTGEIQEPVTVFAPTLTHSAVFEPETVEGEAHELPDLFPEDSKPADTGKGQDESPITEGELLEFQKFAGKARIGLTAIKLFCNQKHDWDIANINDLKKYQVESLKEAIEKGEVK